MRKFAIFTAGLALVLGSLAIPGMAVAHGGHRDGHRHGYSDHRHGSGHRGGSCYGCDGPGSRCDRYGCGYGGPGYYGGGYGGGYGCGYDYPCSQPYQYDCTRYTGPDGQSAQDPQCRYDQKCDCYYHSSEPPPQNEPAPGGQNAQPGPDGGQPPAPDQGAEPEPGPDRGGEQQPRPY